MRSLMLLLFSLLKLKQCVKASSIFKTSSVLVKGTSVLLYPCDLLNMTILDAGPGCPLVATTLHSHHIWFSLAFFELHTHKHSMLHASHFFPQPNHGGLEGHHMHLICHGPHWAAIRLKDHQACFAQILGRNCCSDPKGYLTGPLKHCHARETVPRSQNWGNHSTLLFSFSVGASS